jgi:glycosyltransferase involved in cell wall biosynthesis
VVVERPPLRPSRLAAAGRRAPPSHPPARRLRVGVVAPPWFEIPPGGYGGIEWVCHWLVEGLVDHGHDVTLVAAGRAATRGRFRATFERAPSARLGKVLPELLHAAAAGRLLAGLDLDVIHDHSAAGPLLAASRTAATVVTAHGPVDGELGAYYRAIGSRCALVAISDAQRQAAPDLPWSALVYNGLPVREYPFRAAKEDFVLFLGRMSPVKGAHLAIDAARAAGLRLVMAAKCNEPAERAYFEREIRPRLGPDVEWLGEAGTACKKELLARARCLVFPILWQEPFGIVPVEALACGTPVVALRGGAVGEVVVDGQTGFVGERPEDLPGLLGKAGGIDPRACRERARRFDVSVMVSGCEALYLGLAGGERPAAAPAGGSSGLAAG